MRTPQLSKFYPTAFVTVVVLIAVSVLALSDSFTRAKLKTQSDKQTLEMLEEIFPDVKFYIYEEESEIYTIYDYTRNRIGYAFYAEGLGEYVEASELGEKVPGPIVILVGLEDKATIKGIFVVSHSETDIFWDLLLGKDYFSQFIRLKIEDAYFRYNGGQVDGITGATLSSKLVLNTVREIALEKVKSIR